MQLHVNRRTTVILGVILVGVALVIALIRCNSSGTLQEDGESSSARESVQRGKVGRGGSLTDNKKINRDDSPSSSSPASSQKQAKRRLALIHRMHDARRRMKLDEALSSELLGQWEIPYGYKTVFLIKAPQQNKKDEWALLLRSGSDYSKAERNYVSNYSDQLAQDFYFHPSARFKLVTILTDHSHEDVAVLMVTQRLRTRDEVIGKGGEVKLPTSSGVGSSTEEIDLSDVDENWRYSELLDLEGVKNIQSEHNK